MSTKTDSVRLYKVRKLISELASKEGRGTELVSLYVPPKKPIHEVITNLREEWGTAGNIKSDTTRNHVQDALTKTIQKLKLYRSAPETGLVIFSGALPTNGPGSEVVNLYEIVPPKPVTAYLYMCLAPDTEVLLADGSTASMEGLKGNWANDDVLSYDFEKKKLVNSSIRRYIETSAGSRKSYELVVESGRRILATEDHPFWTPRGWLRLSEIKLGDFVAVVPVPDLKVVPAKSNSDKILLDEDSLKHIIHHPKNLQLVIRRLREWGLLPLRLNDPRLKPIARLMGHIFSDGSLYRSTEQRASGPYEYYSIDSCVGSLADEEAVSRDFGRLGYTPPQGREVRYTMNVEGREYVGRTRHLKVRNSAISMLFIALGAPVGDKVEKGVSVPDWLMEGDIAVQREFLAGFLGGDGPAPRILGRNLVGGMTVSFHRIAEQKENGIKFARQLRRLFENFGIVVDDVRCTDSYSRKDGHTTVEIIIRLKLSEENILKVCHAVSYAYCSRKSASATLIGEYLRVKDRLRAGGLKKLEKARELSSQGVQIAQIATSLGIKTSAVGHWLSNGVSMPLVTSQEVPSFTEWTTTATNGLSEPLVWESVAEKNQVNLSDVRDLTVEQSGHSFVANGFLVHNCDDHFHLDWLKDMLREEKVYGILSIDASEAGLGILSGDSLEIPDVLTSGISGKTRKGGQSARRYERGREMELTYYYHRVAEHATRVFLEGAKVTGMIVGGPGPTKEEFLKGGFLHYELQNKVLAVIDLGYSGREGVRELVEKASDTLKDVRLVEEKKLVQKFLAEVNRPGGLAVYGIPRVFDAMSKANVEVVLVSDGVDTVRVEAKCRKCGTTKTEVAQASGKVQKKQELISMACTKCGATDYELFERDLVDVLEETAFQVGSKVEVISSGTEEGSMFKSFGGVAALLRYRTN